MRHWIKIHTTLAVCGINIGIRFTCRLPSSAIYLYDLEIINILILQVRILRFHLVNIY